MSRRVLAWECKYCGALKKTEAIAERHEIACLKNPDRKNCIDCLYNRHNICSARGCRCSSAVSPECLSYTKLRREND